MVTKYLAFVSSLAIIMVMTKNLRTVELQLLELIGRSD